MYPFMWHRIDSEFGNKLGENSIKFAFKTVNKIQVIISIKILRYKS